MNFYMQGEEPKTPETPAETPAKTPAEEETKTEEE
jgi:hypothetical protein